MKPTPIIISAILGVGFGLAIAWLVQKSPSSTITNNPAKTDNAASNVNVANTNTRGTAVTGPFPVDQDGCVVIDLRDAPPTAHNLEARTYVWLVEHPAETPCVRQTNPVITEPILESTSEKLLGTNTWQLTFQY